jgi:DNA-binding transcriptional regulator/RsmH inhibitor MraZ
VSEDRDAASAAIARLRAAGQPGLDALFDAHAAAVQRLLSPAGPASDPEALRVREALEKVARQRDAHASRLYWYTDLAEAERAARATGRPILSLRLLGDLDEELSCANSRFFRTALYPNKDIGELLRSRFVLHWKSERPAPRVTIDFGDGRKLTRTITGNSIHYVLDAQGRVVDALPGMYGPAAFARGLRTALEAYESTASLGDPERQEALRSYHARQRDALAAAWAALLGVPFTPPPSPRTSDSAAPPANVAAPTAVSKMIVEAPIVQAVQGEVVPLSLPSPAQPTAWQNLLTQHQEDTRLDAASRAFMRSKIAADVDLEGHAMRPLSDAAFERRVAAFERSITEDTVRNEYGMHRVLHEWMAMTPAPDEIEPFNRRVYASLFLTPRSDPWLGLLVKDTYSGIPREGVQLAPAPN